MLQKLLGELEAGKEEDMENYWLIQYQKLLNTKPQSVLAAESKLDHKVFILVARIMCPVLSNPDSKIWSDKHDYPELTS